MVKPQPSKLMTRVRFSSPAPISTYTREDLAHIHCTVETLQKQKVTRLSAFLLFYPLFWGKERLNPCRRGGIPIDSSEATILYCIRKRIDANDIDPHRYTRCPLIERLSAAEEYILALPEERHCPPSWPEHAFFDRVHERNRQMVEQKETDRRSRQQDI